MTAVESQRAFDNKMQELATEYKARINIYHCEGNTPDDGSVSCGTDDVADNA